MGFLDKVSGMAKNLGDKANDAIETTKLNGKISAERTAIAENLRQIGEQYYAQRREGAALTPEAERLAADIDSRNAAITQFQAEIERIKTDASAAPAQSVPTPTASGGSCQACGAAIASGVRFCYACGAAVVPDVRFCQACGATIASGVRFCNACGAQNNQ